MKKDSALDLDDLLRHDLDKQGIKSILDLVAKVSWWINPSIYQTIQVVYPKTRRKKGLMEKRNDVVNGIRLWDNQPASYAFCMALGKNQKEFKNFYVCHIYENSVWNQEHFTNLANMTIFPKCLQSLSEWTPVTEVLKYHSYKIYGYKGPENKIPRDPEYYPELWKHVSNPNQKVINDIIKKLQEQAEKRPTFNAKDRNQLLH